MMLLRKSPAVSGLFIFFSLMISGCSLNTQKLSAKPVQKVNDHVLTTKQFANQLSRKLRDFDALAAKDPNNIHRIKEEILRDFLVRSLTLDWARSQSISISESALDAELNKLRAHYPDDLSFRKSLAQENISLSEWRDDLRYSLIEKEVFQRLNQKVKAVTEDDVRRYYDENKEKFKKKERIYLRQIVVNEEAKADAIKQDLKTQEFAALAKKYSMTPEGKSGGVIGWVEKGSVDYFDPLFAVGSSVQTIKSPWGIHLIRVEKKAPASTAPLDEVRGQVTRTLQAQREQAEYVAWLDAQLRSSKVLKDIDLINSIRVDTKGVHE